MRTTISLWLFELMVLAICAGLVGCTAEKPSPVQSGGSNTPAKSEAAPEVTAKLEDADRTTDGQPSSDQPPTVDEPKTVPVAPPEPSAAEDSPVGKSATAKKVLLGSDDLTSGIPGEGSLTIDQIQDWLAKPENHEPLDMELPLGLNLAAAQIQAEPEHPLKLALQRNPLTRAKIELGRQLYFDTRLSADNSVSCASCHHPDDGFARHTQFGVGIREQQGGRNSPVSYNRILSGAQFWDGRAASLEEQAKGPIANPIEMGNTHDQAVETVKNVEGYRLQFAAVFREAGVTIDSIADAIATFERVIVTGPSAYDALEAFRPFQAFTEDDLQDLQDSDPKLFAKYAAALAATKAHPMSDSALRGRELFFGKEVNCAACHVGANLADEKYHNLGVGMDKTDPDLGRFAVTKDEKDRGAFKTPTVRNVALTAPYMHDGGLKTLEEVVEHYNKGGIPNDRLSDKIKKLNLTDQQKQDLVEFMKACTGSFPKVATGRLPE